MKASINTMVHFEHNKEFLIADRFIHHHDDIISFCIGDNLSLIMKPEQLISLMSSLKSITVSISHRET